MRVLPSDHTPLVNTIIMFILKNDDKNTKLKYMKWEYFYISSSWFFFFLWNKLYFSLEVLCFYYLIYISTLNIEVIFSLLLLLLNSKYNLNILKNIFEMIKWNIFKNFLRVFFYTIFNTKLQKLWKGICLPYPLYSIYAPQTKQWINSLN